jgi:hypothetical protein
MQPAWNKVWNFQNSKLPDHIKQGVDYKQAEWNKEKLNPDELRVKQIEYTIDFLFDGSKSLHRKDPDKVQSFKVLSKVLVGKTIKMCKSASSNKMLYEYKITAERYLIEIESDGKLFMYCESYRDPSPASACDSNSHDKTIYDKVLDPKYREMGTD